MPSSIRRVVTGHDAQGRSIFVSDETMGPDVTPDRANVFVPPGNPLTCLIDLWKMAQVPDRFDGAEDPATGAVKLVPPGGLVFRTVEVPPDSQRNFAAMKDYFSGMGAGGNLDSASARHGAMHKTDTVDFAIILKGEVHLVLDEGEQHLKAGDVVIQRGTNHAWSNRTEESCIFACVLIAADGARGAG
ncbi:MAG: cupin domain-containing protein [Sneathiellaceae bacterium]